MKKTRPVLLVILMVLSMASFVTVAESVPRGATLEYEGGGMGKVIFNGAPHAKSGLGCNDCHTRIFQYSKGSAKIDFQSHLRGREYCFACHNGKDAFMPLDNCTRCHNTHEIMKKYEKKPVVVQKLPYKEFMETWGQLEITLNLRGPLPADIGGVCSYVTEGMLDMFIPAESVWPGALTDARVGIPRGVDQSSVSFMTIMETEGAGEHIRATVVDRDCKKRLGRRSARVFVKRGTYDLMVNIDSNVTREQSEKEVELYQKEKTDRVEIINGLRLRLDVNIFADTGYIEISNSYDTIPEDDLKEAVIR